MSKYIVAQKNKFLTQKNDYDWLIAPCTGGSGKDDMEERVVYTTFPKTLTRYEFDEYIDLKFSNLNNIQRNRMKALFRANTDVDIEKHISFEYDADGAISAMLTQALFERGDDEIRISVGYIKFTRRPTLGWKFLQEYWQSNSEKAVRALQYKYGVQLQQELC